MTENVHIVGEGLIAYLYGEADAHERARVDAHLIVCAACANELSALGATRQHLAEWAPPEVGLGFQIVRPMTAADTTATVLRPARWWNRPTPVWAHAAAAVLIFAAGLLVGTSRGSIVEAPGVDRQPVSSTQVSVPPVAPAQVTELAREVQRLRADLAALSSSPAAAPTARTQAPASDAVVLTRVRELIADSEAGLRTDMTLRDTQLAREVELQRRQDLAQLNRSLDLVNNQTGQALRQNERAVQGLSEGLAKLTGLSAAPGR